MIFADKLIDLRKKSGWSQEDLAEKMDVSRQSVSKWEGAQSVPDMKKIIKLSEIFGVSTDYLLKDDMETPESKEIPEDFSPIRKVTMEEASEFLRVKEKTSKSIAAGVLLCILSFIPLILLIGFAESPEYKVTEESALGIGFSIMAIFIVIAVVIFVKSGHQTAKYDFLEKEDFETEYGVSGMTEEKRMNYKPVYSKRNLIGVVTLILSALLMVLTTLYSSENEVLLMAGIGVTFAIIGIGTYILVQTGIIWASFEKLLQEGSYTEEKKRIGKITGPLTVAYWLVAVAIFLFYSFRTNDWGNASLIFVVAGVLYPALLAIINAVYAEK